METKEIDFNLNEHVKVKLTNVGRQIHRKNFDILYAGAPDSLKGVYRPPKEDENGWSEWQLYELMNEFGKDLHIGMASNNPIMPTIKLIISK